LDLNSRGIARIDPKTCIGCQLCYTACWDGAHQCIDLLPPSAFEDVHAAHGNGNGDEAAHAPPPRWRVPVVRGEDCIGCNLCALVCPVPGCISMVPVDTGRPTTSWNDLQGKGGDMSLLAQRPDTAIIHTKDEMRAKLAAKWHAR
ncbi:MAG: 4Fe-4S dicluster-binding protein, partial [Polyangiaceae bacterium]